MRRSKVILAAVTAMLMLMAMLSAPAMAQSSTPCYGFCDNAPADADCYGFCGNAAPNDPSCHGFCGDYPTTREPDWQCDWVWSYEEDDWVWACWPD
jgi:hypothetical protein